MQLGFVGLGRMGTGMAQRVRDAGYEVVGYDIDPRLSDVATVKEMAQRLETPRQVWVMVPHGEPTDEAVEALGEVLEAGDLVIDGGNSRWTDDPPRAERLAERGIGYVDCGVSGGVWGPEYGYALMVGGQREHVERLLPIFEAIKPPGPGGLVHAGPVGAGHFAKMVHNGIEYGLMQAYAEGFELLQAADVIEDVPGVIDSWTEGTVIRSWLLELAAGAVRDDADLSRLRGYAEDSGAGRWSVEAGVEHAVPTPVISSALYARFASRQDDSPAMKLVAALRRAFGGHAVTEQLDPGQGEADEAGR